ncbi:MAG TPA: ROK family protein, partial [Blastocatellia bacterium]|nr:ROK family protein [Blastocatellia bacterium]
IIAVGIGSPGPLDWETGYVIESAHLKFKDFPLGPRLAETFGHPSFIENDVNAGTYGEFKAGAARGAKVVIGMFVGTGIGGGIIINGSQHHGFTKNAGEIGHMTMKVDGPRCNCGARGCLEAIASKTGMAREIRKAIKQGHKTYFAKRGSKYLDQLSSSSLKQAYDKDDKVTRKVVDRAARYIGAALGSLVNVIGPEVVVLGGGVIEAMGDQLIPTIDKYARKTAFPFSMQGVSIVRSALGDDAGVIGASIIARERFALARSASAKEAHQ